MNRLLKGLLCVAVGLSAHAAGVYTVLSGTGLVSVPSGTVIATQAAISGSYHALAADSSFNYYIATIGALVKVTPAGVVSTLATAPGTSQWISTAVDSSGNIIVADNEQHEIWRVSPTGSSVVVVGPYPTCTTNLEDVYVQVDAGGNYVIAHDNCSQTNLYRMTPAGVVTTVPLSTTIASFVAGLAINTSGNYVTSGYSANSIFQITFNGAGHHLGFRQRRAEPQSLLHRLRSGLGQLRGVQRGQRTVALGHARGRG